SRSNYISYDPEYSFFFSSRRRHTRCYRDWSSDVCSSDLPAHCSVACPPGSARSLRGDAALLTGQCVGAANRKAAPVAPTSTRDRSEERRVGKEGRDRRWRVDEKHERGGGIWSGIVNKVGG